MVVKSPSVIKVEKFLKENSKTLKVIQLNETARSAREAAQSLNTEEGSIVKSLLFNIKCKNKDNPVMALIAGDKQGDEKTIKLASGFEGKLARPNAEYVKKHTGFSIGGVSPLTISKKIPILIDQSLNRFNLLWASAGHTHWVFASSFKTLIRLTNGLVIRKLSKD